MAQDVREAGTSCDDSLVVFQRERVCGLRLTDGRPLVAGAFPRGEDLRVHPHLPKCFHHVSVY